MAPNGRHLGCLALLLAARWSVGDDERRETGALISDGLAWEHSCRAEAGSSCASLGDDDDRFFADRLVRGALRVVEDPECQQGHALDASGPGFSILEAARSSGSAACSCSNAMDRAATSSSSATRSRTTFALKNGTLSMKGSTTHGEDYFVFPLSNREDDDDDRDHARWLMLLPKTFAAPEIVAPPYLTQLLSHPRILGQDFVLNDAGAAIASANRRRRTESRIQRFGSSACCSIVKSAMHRQLSTPQQHGQSKVLRMSARRVFDT
ncbi:hypothetical protein SO694_00164041 [Aureococcus anophagefferens]|uniref:Uncharacterized protein n=1 Tax=Aureococcus anophagefferens TaxID=44056 RepID=A0ABR1G694_AURAN